MPVFESDFLDDDESDVVSDDDLSDDDESEEDESEEDESLLGSVLPLFEVALDPFESFT